MYISTADSAVSFNNRHMHWNESFVITNISNCPRANCNSHLFSDTNLLERDCAWIKEANLWFLLSIMAQGNVQLLIVCITLNKKMVIVSWATKLKKKIFFYFPLWGCSELCSARWIFGAKIESTVTSKQIQTEVSGDASFFTYCSLLYSHRWIWISKG